LLHSKFVLKISTMRNRGVLIRSLFFTVVGILLLHFSFSLARNLNNGKYRDDFEKGASLIGLTSIECKAKFMTLYDSIGLSAYGLAPELFNYAMLGYEVLKKAGKVDNERVISIIDFSKPSSKKRLFIIDSVRMKVLFHTYVAHGLNSGLKYAQKFSNIPSSNQGSLGFYTTADTYIGKHGPSLHLIGMEKGINDLAFDRSIVVHGASYVSEEFVKLQGYIGRSLGCPAVPENLSNHIIKQIKNGSMLLIYAPDPSYARKSAILKKSAAIAG